MKVGYLYRTRGRNKDGRAFLQRKQKAGPQEGSGDVSGGKKVFRKLPGGEDETKLILGLNNPHKPVSLQTIANWIFQTIKMAYDHTSGMKVHAHSTRAVGPTQALFKETNLGSILETADWSKESTFAKFYLRNVELNVLSSRNEAVITEEKEEIV